MVWVVSYSGADPVGSVTDSAGDTFKPAAFRSGIWNGQWFYAANVKGDAFNVITIRPKTTGWATFKFPGIIVLEHKDAVLVIDAEGPKGWLSGAWASAPFGFQMQESYLMPSAR